jgi:hypothetical protein
MSKRLQVLLPEKEMAEIKRLARSEGIPVGEWVRRAMRAARHREPQRDAQFKIQAVRKAAGYSFPTADIQQMLEEIEHGYQA